MIKLPKLVVVCCLKVVQLNPSIHAIPSNFAILSVGFLKYEKEGVGLG